MIWLYQIKGIGLHIILDAIMLNKLNLILKIRISWRKTIRIEKVVEILEKIKIIKWKHNINLSIVKLVNRQKYLNKQIYLIVLTAIIKMECYIKQIILFQNIGIFKVKLQNFKILLIYSIR